MDERAGYERDDPLHQVVDQATDNNQFEIKGIVFESACTDEFITPYVITATADCNVAGTSFTLQAVPKYGVDITLSNVITACTN